MVGKILPSYHINFENIPKYIILFEVTKYTVTK
jgi:hypothetical protein